MGGSAVASSFHAMTTGTVLQEKFFSGSQTFQGEGWGIGNHNRLVSLSFIDKSFIFTPQAFEVQNQAPTVGSGKMAPARHGGSGHAEGYPIENILIGGNFPEGRGPYLDVALGKISGLRAGIFR